MDDDVVRAIHEAALDSYFSVWDSVVIPQGRFGAVMAALASVDDRAGEGYQDTVRAKCAEFGVGERDYYHANPDAAVEFEPECMAVTRELTGDGTDVCDGSQLTEDELDDRLIRDASEPASQDCADDELSSDDADSHSSLGY